MVPVKEGIRTGTGTGTVCEEKNTRKTERKGGKNRGETDVDAQASRARFWFGAGVSGVVI